MANKFVKALALSTALFFAGSALASSEDIDEFALRRANVYKQYANDTDNKYFISKFAQDMLLERHGMSIINAIKMIGLEENEKLFCFFGMAKDKEKDMVVVSKEDDTIIYIPISDFKSLVEESSIKGEKHSFNELMVPLKVARYDKGEQELAIDKDWSIEELMFITLEPLNPKLYSKKQIEFANEAFKLALAIELEHGIPYEVVFVQACLETGYGEYMMNNNLFNIKGTGGTAKSTKKKVSEYTSSGKKYFSSSIFEGYKNVADSWEAYISLLNRRYTPIKGNCVDSWIDSMFISGRPGDGCTYATDPWYPWKIQKYCLDWNVPYRGQDYENKTVQQLREDKKTGKWSPNKTQAKELVTEEYDYAKSDSSLNPKIFIKTAS